MIWAVCKSRITVYRKTSKMFSDTAAASSITVSNTSPKIPATVIITLNNNATGSIDVVGTKGGSPQSSTLNFSSSKIGSTFKTFDTVTSIDCSADLVSAAVLVTAEYRGQDGGPAFTQSTVVSDYPAALTRADPKGQVMWMNSQLGANEMEKANLIVPYTDAWAPQTGDTIVVDEVSKEFMVIGFALVQNPRLNQHYEIYLRKRDGSV